MVKARAQSRRLSRCARESHPCLGGVGLEIILGPRTEDLLSLRMGRTMPNEGQILQTVLVSSVESARLHFGAGVGLALSKLTKGREGGSPPRCLAGPSAALSN